METTTAVSPDWKADFLAAEASRSTERALRQQFKDEITREVVALLPDDGGSPPCAVIPGETNGTVCGVYFNPGPWAAAKRLIEHLRPAPTMLCAKPWMKFFTWVGSVQEPGLTFERVAPVWIDVLSARTNKWGVVLSGSEVEARWITILDSGHAIRCNMRLTDGEDFIDAQHRDGDGDWVCSVCATWNNLDHPSECIRWGVPEGQPWRFTIYWKGSDLFECWRTL